MHPTEIKCNTPLILDMFSSKHLPSTVSELSTLSWFCVTVSHHVICRTESSNDETVDDIVMDVEEADVNMACTLTDVSSTVDHSNGGDIVLQHVCSRHLIGERFQKVVAPDGHWYCIT